MNREELISCLDDLPGMRLTTDVDSFHLLVADGSEIFLEYLPESDDLYLYCYIAHIPERQFGGLAVAMLKANLFAKDTGGSAILAYDADMERIVLWDKIPLTQSEPDDLRDTCLYLYLTMIHWIGKTRQDLLTGELINADGVLTAAYIG